MCVNGHRVGIGCTPPDSCVHGEPTPAAGREEKRCPISADAHGAGGWFSSGSPTAGHSPTRWPAARFANNGSHQLPYNGRTSGGPTPSTLPLGLTVPAVRAAGTIGTCGKCGN